MAKMLKIAVAMLGLRLFIATASEANFSLSVTGGVDVTNEAMSCVSQCPMDNKSMSPSYWCVAKNCFKKVASCAFDWTCRHTLQCNNKCVSALVGDEDGSGKFLDVQKCLSDHCPGFPPSLTCIAKNCKMAAAKCALKSSCRHALECANDCTPSVADVGLAQAEGAFDEDLMATVTDDVTTTREAMTCLSKCPLDAGDMAPSYSCVFMKCFLPFAKCIFNSKCRNTHNCVSECPKSLARSTGAHRFIELGTCVNDQCAGFPPSKDCVDKHCAPEAQNCGFDQPCQNAVQCTNACHSQSEETDLTNTV